MMFFSLLATEFAKLRRTKITWISWAAISIFPPLGGVFVWIMKEPGRATDLGLLGDKAQFLGAAPTWAGYFEILLQMTGIGGMVLVSVIAAYVFGREYAQGTMKNLLGLPVDRIAMVLSKLVIVLIWFAGLILWLIAEGTAVAFVLGLPGLTAGAYLSSVGDVLLAAAVAWLLVPPVGYCAILGRGYLLPLGFTILSLILGMAVGATGWGKWFPWSIVPLFSGVAGPRSEVLAPGSAVVLVGIWLAGVAAMVSHLQWADHAE